MAATLLCVWLPACAGPEPGVYHTVRSGENLYRIGLRYGLRPETIARANGIHDPTQIPVGTRLWIPRPSAASPVSAGAAPAARPPPIPRVRPGGNVAFIWPVRGRITSGFGRRNGRMHEGIDVAASRGTQIRAADAGKVIFCGRLGGYGNMVVIKHEGVYRSVYAHASRILVSKGQFVERGQPIAAVGSTGRATGPHLHFEIRRGESPIDPVGYLP